MNGYFTTEGTPDYEVADIFRIYGKQYLQQSNTTKKQYKVMGAVKYCRTSTFGYHIDQCDQCGYNQKEYNSCRDRHCPKCQGIARNKWIKGRLKDILPVPYYHVVFTLPHFLNDLISYNKKFIYELLLSSASDTLLTFGRDPKWLGGEIGFYGVLHSWGQTLWPHVHVHFVVPAGALTKDGQWREPKYKAKFLFPVRALSKVFRGKFIEGLKKAYNQDELVFKDKLENLTSKKDFELWIDQLVARNWVVYCKPPFGDAEQVVRYIGRYTHRVAISNNRIVDLNNENVRFKYKDYKASRIAWKQMTLTPHEFIRRFLWHVLPKGFHKIRHYGFLANGRCKAKLNQIREILRYKVNDCLEQDDYRKTCPDCRKGKLTPAIIINRIGQIISMKNLLFNHTYAFDTS